MNKIGSQKKADKETLEIDKLMLEKRLLERQLSAWGTLLAWLQAASVPVALLGAILAFYVGYGQLRQGAEAQAAERFDEQLTLLYSRHPLDRLTGVAGLQLFVDGNDASLQSQSLDFLVNQLSEEKDTAVQGAILEMLNDLSSISIPQRALNQALGIAVERDQSLTRSIIGTSQQRTFQREARILVTFNIPGAHANALSSVIPAKMITALSTEEYLALLDTQRDPFKDLDPAASVPLHGLAIAIQSLVARGATSRNFSQIFCEDCDFSQGTSLDGANFDGAFIARANFSDVSLRRASFKNADLGGANFFGADLFKANLSEDPFIGRASYDEGSISQFPYLECADLIGANLSGLPLMLIEKEFDTTSGSRFNYTVSMPILTSAKIDSSTTLDEIGITTMVSVTDAYLNEHPNTIESEFLSPADDDLRQSSLENNLWIRGSIYRSHADDYAVDAANYTETIDVANEYVSADSLKNLGQDAFVLKVAMAQPALADLPLYSKFMATLASLPLPNAGVAMAEKAWRDDAVMKLQRKVPLSCNDHPRSFDLLFEPQPLYIGSHIN